MEGLCRQQTGLRHFGEAKDQSRSTPLEPWAALSIDDAEYQALLDRFAALGYDTTRFRKVIQLPAPVGMPGFWNDSIQ
jgi:hypothetical protein